MIKKNKPKKEKKNKAYFKGVFYKDLKYTKKFNSKIL